MSCKRIIYSILPILLFTLCNTRQVYSQWEENLVVRNQLVHMFSDVDRTKVPTQLLLDYAIDLVELSNYDGRTLTDSNYISLIDYENILRSIRSASVSTLKPFDKVENIMTSFTGDNDNTSLKMSVAFYKYNRIKANALEDGLIEFDETLGKLSDVYNAGTWVNPYEEGNLVAFAFNRSVVNLRTTLSLELTSAFMFSNNTDNIRYILLNAGDGRGWRKITINTPIDIHYTTAGEKEVIVRIVTKNQGELVAHSKLLAQLPAPNNAPTLTIPFTEYEAQPIDTVYNGTTVSATLLLSAIDGNNIKKPFIFVEGFDPGSSLDSTSRYGITSIDMINYQAWTEKIKANNYDLIYVNWHNSLADIRANAALLEKILNIINQDKHNNGSEEKNILMGHSMGGLISRYALCDMESRNETHEVTTYVSYDSPHLGVNLPVGVLYFIPQALSLIHNITTHTWAGILSSGKLSNAEQLLSDVIHAQSVRQMSMNYVNLDGTIDNRVYDEWQEVLAAIGLPRGDVGIGINNLAIANGGEIMGNKFANRCYMTFNGYAKTKLTTELLLPLFSFFDGYKLAITTALLDIPILTDLLAIWGSSRIDWHAEINALSKNRIGATLSRINLIYTKRYLWLYPVTYSLFDAGATIEPNLRNYADDYYASYYSIPSLSSPIDTTLMSMENGLMAANCTLKLTNRVGFVPTMSSLYYKSGKNIKHSDYLINFYNYSDIRQVETPFDALYLLDSTRSHVYNDKNMFDWITRHSDMKIEGDAIARYGSVYTCSPPYDGATIKWSTSNPNIAVIDENTGVLSVIGNGEVFIIAQAEGVQGVLYGTKKKVIVNFPNIVINSEYENDLGYKFTTQFTSEDSSLLALYNSMVADGSLRYEWSMIDGDGNMTTKTTSSNIFTCLPKQDEVVSICVRLVDSDGNKGVPQSTTINLKAPFDVNYRYVVVDSYQNTYFVKSDDTYEEGTPTEPFMVMFRYLALNPHDVGLTVQLKETYLKGNSCYLAYPQFKGYAYWTGTKLALQDKWTFTFFNTSNFLNLLNNALNNAEGEERTISVFPMFICNTEKEQLQSVPFAIIYKPTFASE